MDIDPHTAAGHATHDGLDYSFCSDGCRQDFLADPARYLTPAAALSVVADPVTGAERDDNTENNMVNSSQQTTDPVCGMGVDPATAAANVEHEGATYYFCSTHCATIDVIDTRRGMTSEGI